MQEFNPTNGHRVRNAVERKRGVGPNQRLHLSGPDVAQLNRLFVTYNQAGQIEGVKYDRFATLFVNAFKEQHEKIETQQQFINSQQSEIEQQQAALQTQHEQGAASAQKLKAQLESQQIKLARHQRLIHELRTLVCQTNRQAPVCRKN